MPARPGPPCALHAPDTRGQSQQLGPERAGVQSCPFYSACPGRPRVHSPGVPCGNWECYVTVRSHCVLPPLWFVAHCVNETKRKLVRSCGSGVRGLGLCLGPGTLHLSALGTFRQLSLGVPGAPSRSAPLPPLVNCASFSQSQNPGMQVVRAQLCPLGVPWLEPRVQCLGIELCLEMGRGGAGVIRVSWLEGAGHRQPSGEPACGPSFWTSALRSAEIAVRPRRPSHPACGPLPGASGHTDPRGYRSLGSERGNSAGSRKQGPHTM